MKYDAISAISVLISLAAISILYPLGDSMKIRWSQEREKQASLPLDKRNYDEAKRLSDMWHSVGFWIRTLILIIFVFSGGLLWGFIGLLLASFVYNIIIQIGLKQPWYKLGTTAKIDIFLRKAWKWLLSLPSKIKSWFKPKIK